MHCCCRRSGLLIIGRDFKTGVFDNEANHLLVYSKDKATQQVSLEDGSWWQGFKGTVGLGVEHIRIGTDHIMFIVVLLLLSLSLSLSSSSPPDAAANPLSFPVPPKACCFAGPGPRSPSA